MENRQILVAAIRACATREELEDTFNRFSVSDLDVRYTRYNKRFQFTKESN